MKQLSSFTLNVLEDSFLKNLEQLLYLILFLFMYKMCQFMSMPHWFSSMQQCKLKEGQTHSWPWNTSWDSSAIFHTLTEPSLPPVVTQRSWLKQSSPVMASWCPKLQPITKYIEDYCNCLKGSVLNSILISYSQSLHIRILIHVPHLNWAIVRSTVKIMCSLPEWKTLRKAFYMNHSGTSESH